MTPKLKPGHSRRTETPARPFVAWARLVDGALHPSGATGGIELRAATPEALAAVLEQLGLPHPGGEGR
jgi:propanediol dehydratase large subunit